MGIWTAVVCASALGAADAQQTSKAEAESEIATAQVTLASPRGTAVDGRDRSAISAELSLQVEDRVREAGKDGGDVAELVTRFELNKKDLEVRLKGVGAAGGDEAAKALHPKEGVEGGVALKVAETHDGRATVRVWGTAEVLVDGKSVTDSAALALEARDRETGRVTMTLSGLPKTLASSGRLDLRFNEAAIAVDRTGEVKIDAPEPAIAIQLTPEDEPTTGVGGAGAEGEGDEREAEEGRTVGGAQGAAGQGGQGTAVAGGQASGQGEVQAQAAPNAQTQADQAAQTAAAQPGATAQTGPTPAAPGTVAPAAPVAAPAYAGAPPLSAAPGIAFPPTVADPNSGAGFGFQPAAGQVSAGIGGSGLAAPDALRGTAGAGTSSGPGASSGATFGGTQTPLSGIDFSGSSGSANPPAQTFGFGTPGPIDFSRPVGSPGVPAAAAASPGSPTDLGQTNGAQMSPGIPGSPPPLNNGRFPEALQGGSGFTPGIPASPGVLNDGSFPLGPSAVPAQPGAANTAGGGTAGASEAGNAVGGTGR